MAEVIVSNGTITITNTGVGLLTGNVSAPSRNPPFSETGGGAFSLAPGAHEEVGIEFSPAEAGLTRDKILITSDDPKRKKPIDVILTGIAK